MGYIIDSMSFVCKDRINAVPGKGSKNSKIIFIGEAPGRSEDKIGQLAVANVIMNRVHDRRFPNTICDERKFFFYNTINFFLFN